MAIRTFKLPDPGEGLVEAEIIEWKVAPGDQVAVNQIILEVETAKSLVELPSPWAGTIKELLVEPGITVEVGTPIITIDDGKAEATPAQPAGEGTVEADSDGETAQPTLVGYGDRGGSRSRRSRRSPATEARAGGGGRRPARALVQASFDPEQMRRDPAHPGEVARYVRAAIEDEYDPMKSPDLGHHGEDEPGRPKAKPPVRKLAKDLGIDLAHVPASGEGGVVTREDVIAYEKTLGSSSSQSSLEGQPDSRAHGASPAYHGGERESRVPIKGVRKMTAQAMVSSAFTAPHVTEWITCDVTATMELVERLKADREFRDVKVTPLLVLAKAIVLACRRHPEVNAAWDEDAQEIVIKHYVNLGIAAATPRGLIVPNVKDADAMTMVELAASIGELVATAREGRTQPAQMSGGTITITNVGVFGVDNGTPIINPGESAIIAFGAVRRMPWVVTDADGAESIQPRWVTQLAMSFDHRLIDGELGSRFLADIAAIMSDPARGLVWG